MRDLLSASLSRSPAPRQRLLTIALLVGAALLALVLATLTARPRERAYNETIDVEILVTEPDAPAPQAPPSPPQTPPATPPAPQPAP